LKLRFGRVWRNFSRLLEIGLGLGEVSLRFRGSAVTAELS
jgi:hypothetical protein